MPEAARLILIPKFTRIEGTDGHVAALVTKPLDVSERGAVRIEFGRGPIETDDPSQARLEMRFEESPDGTNWITRPPRPMTDRSDAEFGCVLGLSGRHRWVRAHLAFQGKSVNCWAEEVSEEQ